jgi:serine/threonine protein kinase
MADTEKIPLLAGRYRLLGKIGSGGLGDVFHAEDAELKREVAIKRMRHTETFSGRKEADQVWREAMTMSEVRHPSIVAVHDFGVTVEGAYLVTELMKGQTLEQVLEERPLTFPETFDLARQSLEGLAAAHLAGVVHRDLNPGNFMITARHEGHLQVKLFDFGLAKFLHRPRPQTLDHHNSLLGSIHYMAPEQFDGELIDHRTDLYSLGCILYESLTQRMAFEGETIAQVMYAHLDNKMTPLRELRPDVSADFTQWLDRLIQRHAAARFGSAEEALLSLLPLQP